MQRVCFTLQVRPDRMTEYAERHAAVWPQMLRALHDTGWHNYSLFLREDGLLVGYLETDDLAAALREAGLGVAVVGRLLEIDLLDDKTYDVVRDNVTQLGVGLVRMERRRHHISEIFRTPIGGDNAV